MQSVSQFFSSFSCFSASSKPKKTTTQDIYQEQQKQIDKDYQDALNTTIQADLKTRRISEESEKCKKYGGLAKSSAMTVKITRSTEDSDF